MILAALLLQTVVPQTAVDAERAFNRAAQERGQWTAFRAFAAENGVMFVPQPVKAQDWLKDRQDPPRPVEWWPTESYVSCDGGVAVNTGGWVRPDGSVGYFSTVWQREPDGSWKWRVDHGDTLKVARERPAEPRVVRASCDGTPKRDGEKDIPNIRGTGASTDSTLMWRWSVWTHGERTLEASIWNGTAWVRILSDTVMPTK